MRNFTPVLAFLSLSLLAGCGGGGGGSSPITKPGGTGSSGGNTFPGPGVQPGATGSSGSGSAGQTTGGSDPANPVPATVSRIEISPANATVEANRQLNFTALGKDASGNPVLVPDANWKWTSSNPAVAVLTSTGSQATISGVKAGTATITVLEGKSGVTGSVTLTVTAAGAGGTSGAGGSGLGDGSGSGSGTSASSTQVYANDFTKTVGSEWSSQKVETTPGTAKHAATKFLGQFAAGTVSLNLGNLPAHNSVTVEFDLFLIRTWDGNTQVTGLGPDVWDLSVDGGPTLLHTTFSSISSAIGQGAGFGGSFFQAFPDAYPGGQHPYQSGAAETNTLGFTSSNIVVDSVYHLKYTFANTATAVKFNFTSQQTQDVTDESWGLKNVQVTTNP